jgi:hypothetical protein
MRRELLRRLAKLEERYRPPALPLLRTVWITDCIAPSRRQALAPGERIVLDWESEVNFEVSARERITTDPCDEGRRCEPSSTLPRDDTRLAAPLILEIPVDPRMFQ